jgi:hypothetical protein
MGPAWIAKCCHWETGSPRVRLVTHGLASEETGWDGDVVGDAGPKISRLDIQHAPRLAARSSGNFSARHEVG